MNYPKEISNLERILIDKKYEQKCLQDEISALNEKIKELTKTHNQLNKLSIEAKQVIGDYTMQQAKDIVLMYVEMVIEVDTNITHLYRNFDTKLYSNDDFIHTVMIALGSSIFKRMYKAGEFVVKDPTTGETQLAIHRGLGKNKNLGNQVMAKMKKKVILDFINTHNKHKALK